MPRFYKKIISALTGGRRAQSLIEILIAIAVGTVMILAAVSLISPSLRSTSQTEKTQTAAALGKELLDSIRVFSEANWHNIDTLATTSAQTYFLESQFSPYVVAPGVESVLPDAPTNGLLAYWKFDDVTSTAAFDYSGNGNTATLTGTIPTSSCIAADCLSFGGVNYVLSPNLGNPLTSVTLSAWIKPNPTGGVVFTELGQASINSGWHDAQVEVETDNSVQTCIRTTGEVCVVAGTGIVYGQWYNVVMRYDGSSDTLTGFVNGVAGGSTITTKSSGSKQYYAVGATDTNHGKNGNNFSGLIDDARIYSRALSDAEVKALYNARIYTRYFYVDNVGRDLSNKNIVASGGAFDPSTKKVSVVYGWSGGSSTISQYITRSRDVVYNQTDWSGGAGQAGPVTSTNSGFASSSNINSTGTPGSIAIPIPIVHVSDAYTPGGAGPCSVGLTSSTLGDFIVFGAFLYNGAATSAVPTDTAGDTYTLAIGPVYNPSMNVTLYIWYAKNIAGTVATNTITAQTAYTGECTASEYSGINVLSPLDGIAAATSSASSTLLDSSYITTSNANDLIFGFGRADNPGPPLSPGQGFTARASIDSGRDLSEDRFVTSAGAWHATESAASSSMWIMSVAAFSPQ